MEVYYVIGGVLAGWALLISLLGVVSKDFPKSRGSEIAVAAITLGLVVATIGAAVIGALNNQEEHEDPDHVAVPALSA